MDDKTDRALTPCEVETAYRDMSIRDRAQITNSYHSLYLKQTNANGIKINADEMQSKDEFNFAHKILKERLEQEVVASLLPLMRR